MKSFTSKPIEEPVLFEVDGDEFEAIPAASMPGGILESYFKKVRDGQVFEAQIDLFKFALTEDSYKLFEERYSVKTDKPLTITLVSEIATWLLGSVYLGEDGATEQEQASSSGAPKKRGRTSTATAA